MGKRGKERKKRRLNKTGVNRLGSEEQEDFYSSHSDNDSDSNTFTDQNDGIDTTDDEKRAIHLLTILSRRPDFYQSKKCKPFRQALFPLLKDQSSAYFEPPIFSDSLELSDDYVQKVVDSHGNSLFKIAVKYSSDDGLVKFHSLHQKPLRKALHPLVKLFLSQNSGAVKILKADNDPCANMDLSAGKMTAIPSKTDLTLSKRISRAFRTQDWKQALTLLYLMKQMQEEPKLGTVQRWVRDCDLPVQNNCPDGSNTSFLLLDAVMRLLTMRTQQRRSDLQQDAFAVGSPFPIPSVAVVQRHPLFSPAMLFSEVPTEIQLERTKEEILNRLHIISHVPGHLRRPPSKYDANIYMTFPNTIVFNKLGSFLTPQRYNVPNVPGAFLISNVLSGSECQQIILAAEAIGFVPDAVNNIDNVVWLADDSFLNPIFERCHQHLPAQISGSTLQGINARFRLFRYYPNAKYRPHIDGAWPGSGLNSSGQYTDDAFSGTCHSRLTFLVYLNEGFGGGATTFFLPNLERGPGYVEARGVKPMKGAVLCFPHGDSEGSLVHEGSEVEKGGIKYVIRSDVLYSKIKISH